MKLVALALAALVACRGSNATTKRTGSAAPVEVVNTPQLTDAGHGPGRAPTRSSPTTATR